MLSPVGDLEEEVNSFIQNKNNWRFVSFLHSLLK